MGMMKKLLHNLGRSWDREPKEFPVIQLHQGDGQYGKYTVEGNMLHFHTKAFKHDLPHMQSIHLEELTLNELVDEVNNMGYVALMSSEAYVQGLSERKSYTLMPQRDVPLSTSPSLTTFTSKLWELLYPLTRLLEETGNDIEKAIQQMYSNTTGGKWLDYWASFFRLKREHRESDERLRRRLYATLANIKTNNKAIEEVLRYRLEDYTILAEDIEPATFEVVLNLEYAERVSELYELVDSVKGAGINYLLTYMNLEHEGDHIHLEFDSYDFGVPYRITNILTTAGEKGKIFKLHPHIQELFYTSPVEYPKANTFSVVDRQDGIMRRDALPFIENRYSFEVVYPLCNTFTTYATVNASTHLNFSIAEEYRDSDVVYKRAGTAITGEGEI